MSKKRILCMLLAALMVVSMFAGCGKAKTDDSTTADGSNAGGDVAASGDTIKVGVVGCHTGEYAVYGLAVRNGVELYVNKLNEEGGINGKKVELVIYDNKGDDTEATTAFSRMVDDGITALIGDVLTGNTIAVVGKAYPLNMPMITASATAEAVTYDEETDTVYSNVFRTCFIDPFQGEKMAEYASEKMGAKTAAIFYEAGNDYSVGLTEAFKAKCAELGLEIVDEEAFSTGDMDFKAQLTNIASANPDVVFCPAYYENDGMIITQAREAGVEATFLGGDGWDGVEDYASAEDLEGTLYCSAYAPGSTDDVVAFEEAYIEAYGEETLSMFAANAYDAAMVMCNALKVAEESGETTGSDAYKQAVIDAIRDNSADLKGITSDGYTFDEYNNPIKSAVIMELKNGEATYKETY